MGALFPRLSALSSNIQPNSNESVKCNVAVISSSRVYFPYFRQNVQKIASKTPDVKDYSYYYN